VSDWIKATDLAPLKQRKRLKVTIGQLDIALFYADGDVFALNDVCIHKGNRLSQGHVFKGKIVCPGHQWAFDLRTGWVEQWAKCQPVFPVKVADDIVYVKLEPQVLTAGPPAGPGAGRQG
jgi:nitrite reductase/ring-hydroxylating ferredoxin subunit